MSTENDDSLKPESIKEMFAELVSHGMTPKQSTDFIRKFFVEQHPLNGQKEKEEERVNEQFEALEESKDVQDEEEEEEILDDVWSKANSIIQDVLRMDQVPDDEVGDDVMEMANALKTIKLSEHEMHYVLDLLIKKARSESI